MTKKNYDIVIAGGGMIGTSLALALEPLGLSVAVIEAVARSEAAQPSFDERSTALSRSTQRMFEAIGIWPEVVAASTPITRIHVSDKGRFGSSRIEAEEQGVEALGYVVINRVLGDVLQTRLGQATGIDVLCPAKIVGVEQTEERSVATIELDQGKTQQLHARLLVAADGTHSSVRTMLGLDASQVGYGQRAVIGNLLPEKHIDNAAYERFTEHGPIALLPIKGQRAAFVWIVEEQDAERVLSLSDDEFLLELQALFGYRLGRFSKVGKRASYPLLLSEASELTAPRSVLVGNSAHGLHPVAAQGFNLGMRDVAALCDCVADAQASGDDIGGDEVLARYADWRRDDQSNLVRITDGLVKLFGSKSRPVQVMRNIGMLGFDMIPGMRAAFARRMMGLTGRLPRLSRGVPLR